MSIDNHLLTILQCPRCGSDLQQSEHGLSCGGCGSGYPVSEGIADLRIYANSEHDEVLDRQQAEYERVLHDKVSSGEYERHVVRLYGTKTRLIASEWARELLEGDRPTTVLDYGCGTGQVSRVLCQHFPSILAFDISQRSLRRNLEHNPCVVGVLANALFLPFKNASLDAVCINGVLHHIVNLDRATAEVLRVARRWIFVSEGVPREHPSISRASQYPNPSQKVAYALYATWWTLYAVARIAARKGRRLLGPVSKERKHGTHSQYERPLAVNEVASRLSVGLLPARISYWTNVDIPGHGFFKRWLTELLRNDVVGTHFDLRIDKGLEVHQSGERF